MSAGRKTVVAWDYDDVLYGWYDEAHRLCVRAGLAKGPRPKTWAPHEEYGCTLEEWLEVVADGAITGELYAADPLPGALEAVQTLAEAGVEQHIITARGFLAHADRIRYLTYHSVGHHFGNAISSVVFSRTKGLDAIDLGVTHAIDDVQRNYDDFAAVGVQAFLRRQPWNEGEPFGTRVVDRLDEFVQRVLPKPRF